MFTAGTDGSPSTFCTRDEWFSACRLGYSTSSFGEGTGSSGEKKLSSHKSLLSMKSIELGRNFRSQFWWHLSSPTSLGEEINFRTRYAVMATCDRRCFAQAPGHFKVFERRNVC